MRLLIKIVLLVFLIGALQQMPYGYYQLMRVILFTGCTILGYQKLQARQPIYVVIYGIIAIVYLPLIEYGFKRAEWQLINKITIAVIAISICSELVVIWLRNRGQG